MVAAIGGLLLGGRCWVGKPDLSLDRACVRCIPARRHAVTPEEMALRWTLAGTFEAGNEFRRVIGYAGWPMGLTAPSTLTSDARRCRPPPAGRSAKVGRDLTNMGEARSQDVVQPVASKRASKAPQWTPRPRAINDKRT